MASMPSRICRSLRGGTGGSGCGMKSRLMGHLQAGGVGGKGTLVGVEDLAETEERKEGSRGAQATQVRKEAAEGGGPPGAAELADGDAAVTGPDEDVSHFAVHVDLVLPSEAAGLLGHGGVELVQARGEAGQARHEVAVKVSAVLVTQAADRRDGPGEGVAAGSK